MGRLVVIEGIDGAGKRTLARAVTGALARRGASVGQLAFPRYGEDVHADLVSDALHGRLRGLADSVRAMALLFALDRFGARERLAGELDRCDVVLVDRYIASNAAYQAARLRQDARGEIVDWVRELEVDRLGLAVPDVQFLLRVPAEVAAERAARREDAEQRRCRSASFSKRSRRARRIRHRLSHAVATTGHPRRIGGRKRSVGTVRAAHRQCDDVKHEGTRAGCGRRPGPGRDADHRAAR